MEWVQGAARSASTLPAPILEFVRQTSLVRRFHAGIREYRVTPLLRLPARSKSLGIADLWIKDEATRFALKSFKALGASWAVARLLGERLGRSAENTPTFEELRDPEARRRLGRLTLTTATDGNHGKGLAWVASQLGHHAVIFMPETASLARIEAIENLGARVVIVPGTYDDAVRQAAAEAGKQNRVLVSDTSWEGYRDIPAWVMQGYLTLFDEIAEEWTRQSATGPDVVLLQGGVGALAAAGVMYFLHRYPGRDIRFVVVEPETAACLLESARSRERQPTGVPGNLHTIMAGLACGEPSPLAWEILREQVHAFLSIPDFLAAEAMRLLAAPEGGDAALTAGESGAASLAGLMALLRLDPFQDLRERLDIDRRTNVLCINTEADTNPAAYRAIVEDNEFPVPERFREALYRNRDQPAQVRTGAPAERSSGIRASNGSDPTTGPHE